MSPGVLSHAEGRGLHDPNRRTGGVVRRRRVGTLGAHELVAGDVLVPGGDDPRCETIGSARELIRRVSGAKDKLARCRRREVAAARRDPAPGSRRARVERVDRIEAAVFRDAHIGERNRSRELNRDGVAFPAVSVTEVIVEVELLKPIATTLRSPASWRKGTLTVL